MPRSDDSSGPGQAVAGQGEVDGPSIGSILFVASGLVATVCLLIALFCGVRWAIMETPETTESHLKTFDEAYQDLNAAELIREYQQMEKYSLDMPMPYKYKQQQVEKAGWARNAALAGAVGALAVVVAFASARQGRKRNRTPD